MQAREVRQRLPLARSEHPAERIVQRRHGINRPYPPLPAQLVKRLQIRPLRATGDRHQFQMIKRGQGLKARVGQRINRHHIAGAQKAHHGHRQPVLGAADDQHVFRVGRKAATGQMAGDSFALGEPPGMRLVAQMRFNIPRHRQPPERLAQRIPLRRQRRIVEVEIDNIARHRLLIDAVPRRQRDIPHKGAAPGFAADQPHCFQFTINAGGRGQRDAFIGGKGTMGRQTGSGRHLSAMNRLRVSVDNGFVSGFHR